MTDERHLDPLALDAVRAGDATPEERAHADACGLCRSAVDELESVAALVRGQAKPPFGVPGNVRSAIVARPRPRRLRFAAAALLLVAVAAWFVARTGAPLPGDVDRSGSIDILDAYTLALRLRAGGGADPGWDLNGDGVVDQRDVDEIARRSVALARRGS